MSAKVFAPVTTYCWLLIPCGILLSARRSKDLSILNSISTRDSLMVSSSSGTLRDNAYKLSSTCSKFCLSSFCLRSFFANDGFLSLIALKSDIRSSSSKEKTSRLSKICLRVSTSSCIDSSPDICIACSIDLLICFIFSAAFFCFFCASEVSFF